MKVAIVGAGLTGSLLAVLLAGHGVRVDLIERSGVFGLGLAYGTHNDSHRLNVRADRMGALASDPGHFVHWLERTGHWSTDPDGFVPRRVFGLYIQDLLAETPSVVRHVGEVVAVTEDGVRLADGSCVAADNVVLATGNPVPNTAGVDKAGVMADPWSPGALDLVQPDDGVVLLGSGLTMIDVILSLQDSGWRGQATAISRRGLMPRAHDATQSHPTPRHPGDARLSQRIRTFRHRAADIGWGEAMDELRSLNATLWAGLSSSERSRFLRHLQPWWDVHRHRVAPEVARRIEALLDEERLTIRAGRLIEVRPNDDGVAVVWRPRSSDTTVETPARALIDCTGPGHDPTRSHEPLTRSLLADGLARPDALRLGLDVDANGRLIDASGQPSDRLFLIGPPSRAAVWEIVAVPDIRGQAARLAETLASSAR